MSRDVAVGVFCIGGELCRYGGSYGGSKGYFRGKGRGLRAGMRGLEGSLLLGLVRGGVTWL